MTLILTIPIFFPVIHMVPVNLFQSFSNYCQHRLYHITFRYHILPLLMCTFMIIHWNLPSFWTINSTSSVHSYRFNTHAEAIHTLKCILLRSAFNTHSKSFVCTQAHSNVFNCIHYSLKGVHTHSSAFNHVPYLAQSIHTNSISGRNQ